METTLTNLEVLCQPQIVTLCIPSKTKFWNKRTSEEIDYILRDIATQQTVPDAPIVLSTGSCNSAIV